MYSSDSKRLTWLEDNPEPVTAGDHSTVGETWDTTAVKYFRNALRGGAGRL